MIGQISKHCHITVVVLPYHCSTATLTVIRILMYDHAHVTMAMGHDTSKSISRPFIVNSIAYLLQLLHWSDIVLQALQLNEEYFI